MSRALHLENEPRGSRQRRYENKENIDLSCAIGYSWFKRREAQLVVRQGQTFLVLDPRCRSSLILFASEIGASRYGSQASKHCRKPMRGGRDSQQLQRHITLLHIHIWDRRPVRNYRHLVEKFIGIAFDAMVPLFTPFIEC